MMSKFSWSRIFDSTHQELRREELDVPLSFSLVGGVITTIIFNALVSKNFSYLEQLLAEEGATRNIILILIFLSMTVIIFTIIKFLKVQKQFKHLYQEDIIPTEFNLKTSTPKNISDLIEDKLSDPKSLISIRCRRILQAYINPRTQNAATDIALDDSSFYQSSSLASYSLPRTAIWAIPLVGFIGTVWGIGKAIGGFSGFLGSTGGEDGIDTQQLQLAIDNVTTNLATAFETTLVALVLSVCVMIFLTMVQNKEFRLLRRIDIYIGQKLLSQLEGGNSTNKLDRETIEAAIKQGLQENLPSGQALVEPARVYAKQAATEMAQVFNSQVNTVDRLIQKTEEDTQEFYSLVKQQQQESQQILNNLVETIATNNSQLIKEIQQGNTNITQSFTIQVEQINQQLRQAALALEKQISNLELHAAQISDITKLQNTLTHNLDSLEKTGQLSQTLMELHNRVTQLQPVLNKLQRPRRIMVVDMEENESA